MAKPKAQAFPWLARDIKPSDLPRIYKLLSVAFPKNAIVKGKLWYGLETEGPRGQSVINRLNEVLGINHWHYEYTVEDEKGGSMWRVMCNLKLMIGNWKFIDRMNAVGAPASSKSGNYAVEIENPRSMFIPIAVRSWIGGVSHLSRSEARKGAITNSLKKCAAAFGVAKEVYERLKEPEFEDQEEEKTVEVGPKVKKPEMKPVNEQPLEVKKKGDVYAQLLTEFNSVQDKETLLKAKEYMDKVKGQLTPEQLAEAIGKFANFQKKFN